MIYALYGTENVLIKEFINNIKSRENIVSVINYNFEDTSFNEILEDACYNSLFDDKKLIIVYNSIFLKSCFDCSLLEEYIKNINEFTFLVFVLYEDSINSKLKINKLLKEKCVLKEFNLLSNYKLESLISSSFKDDGYNISNNNINELITRCSGDYSLIVSEVEKLKLYKLDNKVINYEDISCVVSKNIENDIFLLTDAIGKKDTKKILDIYYDLCLYGNDETALIGLIGTEFRLYKQVRDLVNIGFNEKEISTNLGVHPYRIKLALSKINYFSKEEVEGILKSLYNLDYDIKSGFVDKHIGLELFFLSL